jgi:hypothetical protein
MLLHVVMIVDDPKKISNFYWVNVYRTLNKMVDMKNLFSPFILVDVKNEALL